MTKEESWLLKEKYNGIATEAFQKDCALLNAGEPLAYLIGWVSFLNAKIYLDSKPLIPRPETEFWTEEVLKEIEKTPAKNTRILDLCAGSGCVGIALLKNSESSTVDFVEIDEKHHATIAKNIRENGINPARTYVYGGNLFESVPTNQYDFILSNPPYIDPKHDRSEENVRAHEPHTALYGGTDGMEIIIGIINKAQNFLAPHGVCYIEHEPEQTKAIAVLATQKGFTSATKPDQFGNLRYTRLTRKN